MTASAESHAHGQSQRSSATVRTENGGKKPYFRIQRTPATAKIRDPPLFPLLRTLVSIAASPSLAVVRGRSSNDTLRDLCKPFASAVTFFAPRKLHKEAYIRSVYFVMAAS